MNDASGPPSELPDHSSGSANDAGIGLAPEAHLLHIVGRMAHLGAWSLSLPRRELIWGASALRIFEAPEHHAPSVEALLDFVAPVHRDRVAEALQRCIEWGDTLDEQYRALTVTGREVWVHTLAEAVRDEQGHIVRVDGVCKDITEQKLAEVALQESEARFRSLVEGVERVSVQGYDSARRVIFWNKASERLYGYTREEAIGQQLEDLIIPPEMRELVIEGTRQWLEAGVVSVPAEELVLRHKNGSPVPVYSSHTMQRSASGEAQLYCVDVDLSERVQAEALRHQLEGQLREAQKLEAMGTMVGGIAHDFNNVLGAILANVMLAREALPADHLAQSHLGLIAKGGQRARSMVQQILAFSRRQAQELRVVNLQKQVQESLALLQAGLPPQVALGLKQGDPSLCVLADPAQLQQVLMNLCTNAQQALPAGGGRVELSLERVRLRSSPHEPGPDLPDGDYALLTVADNGCGMDAKTRLRIFEPFFTTKPTGQGTGLGLSVVHGIVLAHRGAITVHSVPGAGTRFQIYLPLVDAVADPSSEWGALQAASGQEQGLHIVYVDDDEVLRLTVESLLRRVGYRVTLCSSADQALAEVMVPGAGIALLVTDYNMPGRNGLELAQMLSQLRPLLPVLLSSGYFSDEMHAQALRLGVRGLLHKERLLEELVDKVREVLQTAA
ncbi:hybrid sensor histidine kinase/response regulator [Roseateles toxinivorans]|uniref:histidine kinase n=1 Tax=Roseateles toxinivorans TaxID=270368 RepID=A0A4R6QQS4_9BURK|nr:PAS domain-containing sensor histidine kinase [Roseateles toxinivorans]TDP73093.1 PAS domain S-box-containing protein [Roseateles toxinivorans]